MLPLLALALMPPTFYKDVLPILQSRCQNCHRPGEIGPMPLLTYEQTRPWARSIREAALTRRMPPWFAEGGHFRNDPRLTEKELKIIEAWAGGGAKAGNPKDAPAPKTWTEGWSIGEPDVVFELPEYDVPREGTIEYTDVLIPTGFLEDKWVERIEIRPGNRAVVHHVSLYVREPGVPWVRNAPMRQWFLQTGKGLTGREQRPWENRMGGYAPGAPPEWLPEGYARLFKAQSDIFVEAHYTTNGKPAKDRTRIGLVFAKKPPAKRVLTLSAKQLEFVIPPGHPYYEVKGDFTLHAPSELTLLYPHMHVRGKAMEIRAVYPTGEKEVLIRVPRYDFNWQMRYEPRVFKQLPKGTRIEATGWFDNSANNKFNPDPKAAVRWGDQSWEEMMVGFFEVAIDARMDVKALVEAGTKLNSLLWRPRP